MPEGKGRIMVRHSERHSLAGVRLSSRRRGFTMMEVLISSVISGMVSAMVVWLMFQAALTSKDMYAETRTRSTRMGALDQIRYRLIEAQIGTVDITQANRRIEFMDPNLGVTSAFFFNPDPALFPNLDVNTLYYDEDIDNSDPRAVVEGPIDLTFETESAGAIVKLNVRTQAPIGFGDVDTQDGETVVYLRNV
jgi:prepilin-type N-terminal cleavage/methylation domain-containing protein